MIPTLNTERLVLGPFALEDGPRVEALTGQKAVAAHTANIPHPYPPGAAAGWIAGHAKAYLENIAVTFAVRVRGGELVGCVSLGCDRAHRRAELGYWLGVDYWNQGYTTEAARACVAFGFGHFDLVKVVARHFAANPASGKVMEKLGMRKEGFLRRHFQKNGVFHDIVEYGVLREEWD